MATKKKAKSKAKKAKKAKKKTPARGAAAGKRPARKPATKKVAAKKKPAAKAAKPKKAPPKAAPKVAAVPAAPAPKPAAPAVPPGEEPIGIVTHYYTHLQVAIVKLETGSLRVGEVVHIKGHTSDFTQPVESMEVEHMHVNEARSGQSFGLRVKEHAREHDVVYRVKR
jgi:putative protease